MANLDSIATRRNRLACYHLSNAAKVGLN